MVEEERRFKVEQLDVVCGAFDAKDSRKSLA